MNTTLARKINQMAEEDQRMRSGHKKGTKLDASVDKRHTTGLKRIIKEYGWPTISLVGRAHIPRSSDIALRGQRQHARSV